MAVTVTPNLSLWSAADAATGWNTDGDSLATYAGFQREGSNCLGAQVSQTTSHFYISTGSGDAPGSSVNMTGQRVYAWVFVWGSLDTKANGGLRIILGDGTNRRAYYVGGSDDYGHQVGGWTCIVLDCGNLPSSFATLAGASAPTLTAITSVGVGAKFLNKATGNVDNFYFDIIRYGTGLTITGGTAGSPGVLAEIAAADASTSNAWGIIREIQAGVYGIQGSLIWGDNGGTATFYFKDENAIVIVEDRVHGPGTPTTIALAVVGNSTAATQHFELGVAVGSGDAQSGRNGVQFRNANLAQPVTWDASDPDLDEFACYGCTWDGIVDSGVDVAFSADATLGPNHVLSGCTFSRCGQVDLGRVPTRNCVFSGYVGANAALLWNANIDIERCQFLANTDATNDPAAIEHPTAGTFSYVTMMFSNNDYDVLNSAAGVTVDSYADSNRDGDQALGDGTTTGVGQSFDGQTTTGKLSNARFFLSKTGAPTGPIVAKLYALSGTLGGGDDVPTGAALATSDQVESSSLTGTPTLIHFNFQDEIDIVSGTDYVIAIETDTGYSGDGSNHVLVGRDASTPSHTGNMATLAGTWSAVSGTDVCFFVSRDGVVKVQATENSNPGTYLNTGSPPGGTVISNAVNLKVTATVGTSAVAGARVRIQNTSGVLITQGTTNSSGIFTDSFNYTGDLAVEVIVRLKGFLPQDVPDTIVAAGLNTPVPMTPNPTVNLP